MFPIINIGPLAVQAAGLLLLVSFFLGSWLSGKFAKALTTNADAIENSILFGLIAGILGARIGFMLIYPQVLISNPLNLVSLTPSMLDASFGVLVGILTALIIAQKKHLPLWPTLDTLAPFFILIFTGIHLANYANGEAYGLPTQLPWGIQLWNAVRHPVQLYALILAAVLFAWLSAHTRLFTSTGFMRSGVLFNLVLAGLGFITLFTRAFIAEKVLLGNIDFYQLIALLVLLGSFLLIYNRAYPARKKVGVIISMGSNLDPQGHLSKAFEILSTEFRIRRKSSRYLTEDIKRDPQTQDFLNQVIEIETDLSYPNLSKMLKSMEQALGREPGNKQRVPLDLDILTYAGEVFTYQGRQIPAPDMLKYQYVAQPLAEMSPGFCHPANGLSIQEILEKIQDDSLVRKMNEVENEIEG
jgi:phosphatidylglycerol---prolipoprotein diacylglyceryl transferase